MTHLLHPSFFRSPILEPHLNITVNYVQMTNRWCQKPSWRSWLARQSHNLKVVSSSLTEGILFCLNSMVTWITLMDSPVSCESFSLIWRVGFGVLTNAFFRVSNCFAFIVVLGPLRFAFWFSLLSKSPKSDGPKLTSFIGDTKLDWFRTMTNLDYHWIRYIFHPRGYFQFHQRNHLIDRSDVYNTDSLFDRRSRDY